MQSRLCFMGCDVETLYCVPTDSKPHSRLEMHIVTVSPQLATHWLTLLDPDQRNKLPANLEKLQQDIAGGRWEHTHQGICFNEYTVGSSFLDKYPRYALTLVDGQHRLSLIAKLGIPLILEVSVFRGLTVRSPIDVQGTRRKDFLTGLGSRTTAVTTSALRLIEGVGLSHKSFSAGSVSDGYAAHRTAIDETLEIMGSSFRSPVVGVVAFAYPINPELVLRFAKGLVTGAGLGEKEPVFILRETLIRKNEGKSFEDNALINMTAAALLASLEGRELTRVYATRGRAYEKLVEMRNAALSQNAAE